MTLMMILNVLTKQTGNFDAMFFFKSVVVQRARHLALALKLLGKYLTIRKKYSLVSYYITIDSCR